MKRYLLLSYFFLITSLVNGQLPIIEEGFYRIKCKSSNLYIEGSTEIWGEVLCNAFSTSNAQIWEAILVEGSTDTYNMECNHGGLYLACHNKVNISMKVGPYDPSYYSERFTISSAGTDLYYLQGNWGSNYMEGSSSIGSPALNRVFDGSDAQKWIFEAVNMDFNAPQIIRAFNLTNNEVDVSWSPSYAPASVELYEVYKNNVFLGNSYAPDTSYHVYGLTEKESYTFKVRAKDKDGNYTEFSDSITITTPDSSEPDITPPTIPSELVISGVDFSYINLSWEPSRDNIAVEKYAVYIDGIFLSEVYVPNTYIIIDDLSCGKTYDISVSAFDLAGNESPKSVICKGRTALCVPENALKESIYRIKNEQSGLYLESNSSDSTIISGSTNAEGSGQLWKLEWKSEQEYRLKCLENGLYMSADTTPGSVIRLSEYSKNRNSSHFSLNRISESKFTIESSHGNLMVQDGGTDDANATAQAANGESNQTWEFERETIGDNIKPSAPSNLVVSNLTGTGFQLSWEASTDNVGVDLYQLFRAGKCVMNNIPAPTNTVYVSGIAEMDCGSTGSYKLRARDASINFSAYSPIIKVTNPPCPDHTPPSIPLNLVASNAGETSVDLSWEEASDNRKVYKYAVFANSIRIAEVHAPANEIRTNGLSCNTNYDLVVRAVDRDGNESENSNVESVLTSGCNSILNKGFETYQSSGSVAIPHWTTEAVNGADADRLVITGADGYGVEASDGIAFFRTTIISSTLDADDISLSQDSIRLEPEKHYLLSFDLRKMNAIEAEIDIEVMNGGSNESEILGSKTIKLAEDEWETVSVYFNTFELDAEPGNAIVRLLLGRNADCTVLYFDNFLIEETDEVSGLKSENSFNPFNEDLVFYPNPASEFIAVLNLFKGRIVISSLDGRMLLNKSYNSGDLIDISELKSGAYLVRAIGSKSASSLFIKR